MALGKAQLYGQNEFMVDCVQSIICIKIEGGFFAFFFFLWGEMVKKETYPNYLRSAVAILKICDLCF